MRNSLATTCLGIVRGTAALLLVALALWSPASPVLAAGRPATAAAETFHLHVPAVAELVSSSCPFGDWAPTTPTLCENWRVVYFREAPPSELRGAPWVLFVEHSLDQVYPDGSATSVYDLFGQQENPPGTFDLKAYTYASVSGSVPMSDGSVLPVKLTWDMSQAPLNHGGNDSAYNVVNGFDRHTVDRCVTVNQHAHQQWRYGPLGHVSGTLGSVNVQSLTLPWFEPFIAGKSIYTVVVAQHGGCQFA